MKDDSYEKSAPEASDMSRNILLRTCLDPESEEWNQTTMQKKIDILRKQLGKGNSLQELIIDYRSYYIDQKRVEVAQRSFDGLVELLNHTIKDKFNYQVIVER